MASVSRHAAAVVVAAVVAGTVALPPATAQPASCRPHPDTAAGATEPVPSALTGAIADHLSEPGMDRGQVALSIWVEGYGEVASQLPDRRLRPASVQKILTAMAAFEVLGPDTRMSTAVVRSGPVVDGTLRGNLYLVGGGDPSLASRGRHSLQRLADLVRRRGIDTIAGGVVVDESRFDSRRDADGWEFDDFPGSVGSLSALTVDGNEYRGDIPFFVSPALHNGRMFGQMLSAAGVVVGARPMMGRAPEDTETIVRLRSAPVSELVAHMLTESDNTYAELLTKEIGLVASGRGSTGHGVAAAEEVALGLCSRPSEAPQGDGSGLSDLNGRSAREWRMLLQQAQARDWYPLLIDGLAVAGETGTLESRFLDTAAEGNMRAKTGTIDRLRALSGVMTTAGGRRVFFAVVIQAGEPFPKMQVVDALLADIAADRS
jgi:D-alanyl-D-alanine carboxypeptidase/D-alanyl-D-alanine-endopeptidase (penicillin-binding protein 4)